MRQRKVLVAVSLVLAVVLAACGGGGSGGGGGAVGSISGQVSSPDGQPAGTVVSLCVAGSDCTGSDWLADAITDGSGNFSFPSVSAGSYDVRAVKVLNTFPVTRYEGQRQGVQAPTSGLVIQMQLAGAVPESGTVFGTVSTGGASLVTGTTVYLCQSGIDCSTGGAVRTVTVRDQAPQGTFEFRGVQPGTYTVVAVQENPYDTTEFMNRHYGVIHGVTAPSNTVALTMKLEVVPPGDGTSMISGTIRYPGAFGTTAASDSEAGIAVGQFIPARTPQADMVPNQLVVRFDDGALRTQADLSVMNVGGFTLQRLNEASSDGFHLYEAAGASTEQLVTLSRQLRAQPGVLSASPNWILHGFRTPNDTYYPVQWHYQALNLEKAWDVTTGSTAVTVAVVDSGGINHPDLPPLQGWDFVSDVTSGGDGDGRDSDPTDVGDGSGYHGAHVAGTIGARSNNASGVAGVNWNTNLIHVRALGKDGSGSFIDILEGIAWAAGQSVRGVPANPNPAQVINLSLGADMGVTCSEVMGGDTSLFTDLAAAGVIMVVAAGNSNIDAAGTFPANCPGVITVGATGPDHSRAPYSNYGSTIDVMAPGGDTGQYIQVGSDFYPAGVLSTVLDSSRQPILDFMQGTSMAAPHIAGVVALMLAHTPGLSYEQVLGRLRASSWHPSCGSAQCGSGLVDAFAAITGSDSDTPTPGNPPGGAGVTTWIDFFRYESGTPVWEGWVEFKDISLLEVDYLVYDIPGGLYDIEAFQNLNGYPDGMFAYRDDGEPYDRILGLTIPSNTHTGGQDLTLRTSVGSNAATVTGLHR